MDIKKPDSLKEIDENHPYIQKHSKKSSTQTRGTKQQVLYLNYECSLKKLLRVYIFVFLGNFKH